jgi:hypothetical protein
MELATAERRIRQLETELAVSRKQRELDEIVQTGVS